MTFTPKKACGLLFCFNEEHIIGESIDHYLSRGIDLVVFDNESTDSSLEIVERARNRTCGYTGRIMDVVSVSTNGFEWDRILRSACDYMHHNLVDYKWILLIESDAFYLSPVNDMSLLEFMEQAERLGYTIINMEGYEFYPTEKDDVSIPSAVERMRYCRLRPWAYAQHKLFRYHPSVDFHTRRGHICLRDDARVFPVSAWFNHYPWVSVDHGLKKIFTDRNPRIIAAQGNDPKWSTQYLNMDPSGDGLVRRSETLWYYDERKLRMSRSCFFRIMKRKELLTWKALEYEYPKAPK